MMMMMMLLLLHTTARIAVDFHSLLRLSTYGTPRRQSSDLSEQPEAKSTSRNETRTKVCVLAFALAAGLHHKDQLPTHQ